MSAIDTARKEYLDLFESEVRAHPEYYKRTVQENPRAHGWTVIEHLLLEEVRRFTRELRAEIAEHEQ